MRKIMDNLKNLLFVILSGICSYYHPISKTILNIKSEKILNGFDIAIYTTLFLIIVEIVNYFFDKNKMNVRILVIERRQETDKLILRPEMAMENYEIILRISINGVKRSINRKLVVKLPDYFTIQVSRGASNFVKIDDTKLEIDLSVLISELNKELSVKREVEFNLSLDNHNKGNSDLMKFGFDKIFINPLVTLSSNGLLIEQQGE